MTVPVETLLEEDILLRLHASLGLILLCQMVAEISVGSRGAEDINCSLNVIRH